MKGFKKWETEDCYSRECPVTDCSEVACTDCEDLREAGWRAALEWVLGQHCHGDWDDGSALETAIKQELGDT